MRNIPIASYEDVVSLGKGFSAVRAYDVDQVDGLCIQAPACSSRSGQGIGNHDDFCPMFSDYSCAPEAVVREQY